MKNDGKITRFPITGTQRHRNRLGRRAVPCLVSGRWLAFPEKSEFVADGHHMFVDVMTMSGDENPRKLCTLCISKEDLLAALEKVD